MFTAPNKKRLIIFDCDGVLVDSELIITKHFIKYLHEFGYQISMEDAIKRFSGKSATMVYQEINLESNNAFSPDLIEHIQKQIHLALHSEVLAVNGIAQLIAAIQKNDGDDICIASSGTLEKINKSLRVTGLQKYFHHKNIFSAQSVKKGKPNPDLFLFAAKQMGYQPTTCVVIEDSIIGIKAALAAGMQPIAFLGGSHTHYSWYQHDLKQLNISIAENTREFLEILIT